MHRFFFDTSIGDSPTRDNEGIEYPDEATAIRDARRSLSDLVAEAVSRSLGSCAVTIRDSGGRIITRVSAELREEDTSE